MDSEVKRSEQGRALCEPEPLKNMENDQRVCGMDDQREKVIAQRIQAEQRLQQKGKNHKGEGPVLPEMIRSAENPRNIGPGSDGMGEKEETVPIEKVIALPKE